MSSALVGTGTLLRFCARRDRVRLPIWIGAIGLAVFFSAVAVQDAFPDQDAIDARTELVADNPALIALSGPTYGYDEPTLGKVVANELGLYVISAAAAMSIFLVVRHTRADEESERGELVRAGAVGRAAPLVAPLLLATLANVAVATVVTLGVLVIDVPVAGSVALGASAGAVGIAFAGIAAIAAQVTTYARGATGLAVGALGLAFVLRAVGDVGNGVLSWFSPIGWGQATRPYAGEVWWPLGLAVGAGVASALVAVRIATHRDLGAGLVAQRPGSPVAAPGLGHPAGFAFRLQRAVVISWIVGMTLFAAVYGSVGEEVEHFLEERPELSEMFDIGGASLVDSFFASIAVFLALCIGGFAIQVMARLRTEETGGRVEPLLATPLSRDRWLTGTLVVAVVGSAAVLVAAGLGLGLSYAGSVGDLGGGARLVAALVVHLPAVLVLVGLALALFGTVPRLFGLTWVLLGVSFVAWLSELFGLPDWFRNLSPFAHTPAVPAASFAVLPVVVLLAIALALGAVGFAGLRRRDLAT